MEDNIKYQNRFSTYINTSLNFFEFVDDYKDTGFFVSGTHMTFFLKHFSCSCRIFYNKGFFFEVDFKIDDSKYPNLRKDFYENLQFVWEDQRKVFQDEKQIILKSEISESMISEAKEMYILSITTASSQSFASKHAIQKIILFVFFEFRNLIQTIWKKLAGNFEFYDCPSFLSTLDEKEDYNLVKQKADKFQKTADIIHYRGTIYHKKKKKTWIKKIYIWGKRLGIFK